MQLNTDIKFEILFFPLFGRQCIVAKPNNVYIFLHCFLFLATVIQIYTEKSTQSHASINKITHCQKEEEKTTTTKTNINRKLNIVIV